MFTIRNVINLPDEILVFIPLSGLHTAHPPRKGARINSPPFANGPIANLLLISKSDFAAASEAR